MKGNLIISSSNKKYIHNKNYINSIHTCITNCIWNITTYRNACLIAHFRIFDKLLWNSINIGNSILLAQKFQTEIKVLNKTKMKFLVLALVLYTVNCSPYGPSHGYNEQIYYATRTSFREAGE